MKLVEFHPAAEEEFLSTADFYDRRARGLGSRYELQIRRVVTQIQKFPEIGRAFTSRARRVLVPEFPYAPIYRLESERILILAVMHLRRRPGYWRSRSVE